MKRKEYRHKVIKAFEDKIINFTDHINLTRHNEDRKKRFKINISTLEKQLLFLKKGKISPFEKGVLGSLKNTIFNEKKYIKGANLKKKSSFGR